MVKAHDFDSCIPRFESSIPCQDIKMMQRLIDSGWKFIERDDLFKTIVVTAPNGYMASLSMVERNPGNVFYMMVKDMMNERRKDQEQSTKAPDAS